MRQQSAHCKEALLVLVYPVTLTALVRRHNTPLIILLLCSLACASGGGDTAWRTGGRGVHFRAVGRVGAPACSTGKRVGFMFVGAHVCLLFPRAKRDSPWLPFCFVVRPVDQHFLHIVINDITMIYCSVLFSLIITVLFILCSLQFNVHRENPCEWRRR